MTAATQAPLIRGPEAAGDPFDKYTLLAKLATGGMAEIFVARLRGAAGFRKNVVIKRILPHVAHDKEFIRMFLDEALTTARITHPNVCQVFELCEFEGSHFLVLEYLEGIAVSDLLRRKNGPAAPLDVRFATGIVAQACDGLHAAHEQIDDNGEPARLVHRDVSPGNIFVTVDGIIKVLDFGIAKAKWVSRKTRTGTLLGKCEYMSPEQARGGIPLDRRSDVFSLGIILYELLTGKRLFRRENDYDTLKAVLTHPVEPVCATRSDVPEAIDAAILRALEKDRAARFNSAYEFRKALESGLRHASGVMPLCDIGPLIRKRFGAELEERRRTVSAMTRSDSESNHDALWSDADPTNLARPALKGMRDHFDHNLSSAIQTEPNGTALDYDGKDDGAEPETIRLVTNPVGEHELPLRASELIEARHVERWRGNDDTVSIVGPDRGPRATQTLPPAKFRKARPRNHQVWPYVALSAVIVALVAGAIVALPLGKKSQEEKDPAGAHGLRFAKAGVISTSASDPAIEPTVVHAAAGDGVATKPIEASDELPTTQRLEVPITKQLAPTEPGPAEAVGYVTIHTERAAKLFLYTSSKDKLNLGPTPIDDFTLPVGVHKFKLIERRGRNRYFHMNVRADETTRRDF